MLKVANLLYDATEWIKVLNLFRICFFLGKLNVFFWKKLTFLKSAKDKKFVVGCNWISQIFQNVEKVAYSWGKKIGFSKKQSWVLLRTA